MRWRSLALAPALLAVAAAAQTTTTVTGTIKDLTGAVVTSGQITFDLQPGADTTISGSGRFVPTTITCQINGSGQLVAASGTGSCVVTQNTALTPPGTYYLVTEWPNFVAGAKFNWYAMGASQDISSTVPTPATAPAYTFVDTQSNQTIGGGKSFTGATGMAELTATSPSISPTSIERVLYADLFAGADIGAQVNAANAACAAYVTAGCAIVIPAGSYSFSTSILITTRAMLVGQGGGAVLTYAGSGTAITLDIPSQASNLQDANKGVRGIMLLGPSASGSTVGVLIEGPSVSSSATGVQLNGVTVRGFGIGVKMGNNAYWTRFQDTSLEENGINFSYPSGLINSGEQISFEHSFIADSTVASNIDIESGAISLQITDTSLDCGSPALNVGSGAASAYINISGSHFECGSLTPAIAAANGIIAVVNSTFLQDAASGTLTSLISVSGSANLYVQQSGFQTLGATVTNLIANSNTGDVVYGANNTDSGNFANILSSPTSAIGTWFGRQLLGATVVGGSGFGDGFAVGPSGSNQCITAFAFGAAGPFMCNLSDNSTEMSFGYGSSQWMFFDSSGISFPNGINGTMAWGGGPAITTSGSVALLSGSAFTGGISAPTITNACAGVSAAMVAGTVTVSAACITGSRPMSIVAAAKGGAQGFLSYTESSGSLVITSSSSTDTSTVSWVQN